MTLTSLSTGELALLAALALSAALALLIFWNRYSTAQTVYIHCHAVCTVMNDRRGLGSGESRISVSVPVRGNFVRKISRWKANTWKGKPELANATLVKRPLRRLKLDKVVFADGSTA